MIIISKWINEKTKTNVDVVLENKTVKTITKNSFNSEQVNIFKNKEEVFARLEKGNYINYQVLGE